MKALVINCQRNGLGVIRSLGEQGVEVFAADHTALAPGLHSKYVKKHFIVPEINKSVDLFISSILDIAEQHASGEKMFLLPMNDEYVLTFAQQWKRLEPRFHPVFETDLERLQRCVYKDSMYDLAESTGVPIPRTIYSPLQPKKLEGLSWPLIVKPKLNRSPENLSKEIFRIRFCHNKKELEEARKILEEAEVPYLVQEYIPGNDDQLYSAGIFAYRGEIKAAFTGRKIRQFPPHTGECSHAELVNESAIIEYSQKMIRESGYTGIAQFEFKRHNGTFYIMEINPRSWSWNSIGPLSGVNLPWIGCSVVLNGGTGDYVAQTRTHGTWNYLFMDLFFNAILNRNARFGTIIRDAWKADCHAFWVWNDPGPALWQLMKTFMMAFGFIFRKIKSSVSGKKESGDR